jgi:hypothetical protein
MKKLGRMGGKASGSVKPEQMPASLREELRKLDPTVVRGAIEQALAGGNESARVSAVKLLADIDAFGRDRESEDRTRAMAIAGAEARERLAGLLNVRARGQQRELRHALDELAVELRDEAVDLHPDLTRAVFSDAKAAAVLEGLEEVGLIVPRGRLEEMAEARALELLASLKAEHGIPA